MDVLTIGVFRTAESIYKFYPAEEVNISSEFRRHPSKWSCALSCLLENPHVRRVRVILSAMEIDALEWLSTSIARSGERWQWIIFVLEYREYSGESFRAWGAQYAEDVVVVMSSAQLRGEGTKEV